MPNPEGSMLPRILTADPAIEHRASMTRRLVPESELNTMGGLSRRAVDNTHRFIDPNFVGYQTPWVGVGNMEVAIRAIGDDFDVHAHILMRDEGEEKIALDLHRERAVDEFGKPVNYCDVRTVVDYIQAALVGRKAA